MLCVSGTETMFAAMGHFSQPSVAVSVGKVWGDCGGVGMLACAAGWQVCCKVLGKCGGMKAAAPVKLRICTVKQAV